MTTRYEEQGHARYLTFSCYKRKHLFRHANLQALFIHHLDQWRKQYNVHVIAFVVMPNHVHLLVHADDGIVGPHLRVLKSLFARAALQQLRQDAPVVLHELAVKDHGEIIHRFWQAGGGYDRNIFQEDAVVKAVEYIHNNPVRAGLVDLPEEYAWSSARFWLKGEPVPLAMDVPEWW